MDRSRSVDSSRYSVFYLVPSEFREDGQAVFRVLINPMVWWMWASGPILVLGTILSLSPNRRIIRKLSLTDLATSRGNISGVSKPQGVGD